MKELESLCECGSGKSFEDCCFKENPAADLAHYKIDQAERDLRMKLIDFSNRPEIQAQIGEAFYIWMNDPELSRKEMDEDDIDDLTFTKFLDWFIYDFKLLDTGKRLINRFHEEESRKREQEARVVGAVRRKPRQRSHSAVGAADGRWHHVDTRRADGIRPRDGHGGAARIVRGRCRGDRRTEGQAHRRPDASPLGQHENVAAVRRTSRGRRTTRGWSPRASPPGGWGP